MPSSRAAKAWVDPLGRTGPSEQARDYCSVAHVCTIPNRECMSRRDYKTRLNELNFSFLQMVRDASFAFPASGASGALALRPAAASMPAGTAPAASASSDLSASQVRSNGVQLNLGPVSLNVGGNAGGALEEGVETVKDGLRDLFSRARRGVDGVRLG